MKHLGLFEGIGGFSLAARWAGWETVAWCEINPFGQKVLKYHFPEAEGHSDIKETDFTKYRNAVDIITGGFPCQPYSTAGKRKGKEDDRHLWPEMLRAIREVSPRWVVGENVRGLTNWNGGLVFDEVQADLEAEGYEVLPFLLPACAVNAPHRRDRIWFVAYSVSKEQREQTIGGVRAEFSSGTTVNSNASGKGLQRSEEARIKHREGPEPYDKQSTGYALSKWFYFPTQSPLCRGNDGVSYRLDGISFPKWRNESIKAYGNAVVPALVYEIFKAINEYEAILSA